jgi:hypothetical protein
MISQHLLKFGEGGAILEHGELAVRIAGIVTRTELNGIDVEQFEFIENRSQRKMRQQRGKNSNAHYVFPLP